MVLKEKDVLRFHKSYIKTPECWVWNRTRGKSKSLSYGRFVISENGKEKIFAAHRYAYLMFYGFVPEGKCVLHRCDNPLCVRPEHLFVGTVHDNVNDMLNKGRQAKGGRINKAVLKEEDIPEIRRLYALGFSVKDLSASFGCGVSNIYYILRGKTWRHIGDEGVFSMQSTVRPRRKSYEIQQVLDLGDEQWSVREIASKTGVSKSTVGRVLKRRHAGHLTTSNS